MRRWRIPALLIGASILIASSAARSNDDESFYHVTNLVSDGSAVPANAHDPDLVNAWGLSASPTGPWWVADNGTGKSTLYDGMGTKLPLTVTVPGSPTGQVWNGGPGWMLSPPCAGRAIFMWASEDGTISGWNPSHPMQACVRLDESDTGAVFKGLAEATDKNWIYATDFHNNKIEVYDADWNDVETA